MTKRFTLLLVDAVESKAELFRQELDDSIEIITVPKVDEAFQYFHSSFKGMIVVNASIFMKTDSDSIVRLIARVSAQDLPLIYILSSETVKMREDLLEKGGCDYLLEPLKAVEIRKKLNLHFSRLELKELVSFNDEDYPVNTFLENKELKATVEKLLHNEKQLKELKKEAELMSQLKSTFIGTISHELRTPLNSILGISQLLADDIKENRHRDLIRKVDSSGRRLMRTLNSILDLSLLESQEINVTMNEVNLRNRVERIVEQVREVAAEKNLEIYFESAEDVCVMSDECYLDQIISNIFDNALKFTESGSITVTVREESSDNRHWGTVSIADTGIGIEKAKYDLIFEEYRQASEGYSRLYEGAGLGLTIAKKMVDKLHGVIEVGENDEHGSVFVIKFPIYLGSDRKKNESREKKELVRNNKPRVLLVEDNLINVEITEVFLNSICQLDSAKTGEEAIALAEKTVYDAILMDINLGKGMNGIQTAKKIRTIPQYETTPIVALTGYAMVGDREKFLTEGMTHYLAKPFIEEDLVTLVDGALSNRSFTNGVR